MSGSRRGTRSSASAAPITHASVVPALTAVGSLPRPAYIAHPGLARRLRLIGEMVVLYLVIPVVMTYVILAYRLPLFTVLPPLVIAFTLFLLADRSFSMKRELLAGFALRHLFWMALVLVIAGGALAFAVAEIMPREFLAMPRERPQVWRRVMLFYPLLSVIPQEIAYRTFFFHRYGPLFDHHRWAMIGINALLFGFGHVLFGNWLAVVGTTLTGALFAYRYERSRSLWAVAIEHSLWGMLVFTIGLGGYFFTGIAFQGDFRLPWISK